LGDAGHVALTFNDGPDPVSTPLFLDALATAGVRATFFVVGQRLARHRWLGRLIMAAGHEIAVHGWTHVPAAPGAGTRLALIRTTDLIADVTGVPPRWYRPPYGLLAPGGLGLMRDLGLQTVLWTAWGRDWGVNTSPGAIARRVGTGLRGGATVLLHDRSPVESAWRSGLAALPRVLAACHRRGLAVGPLGEHGSLPAGSTSAAGGG
jgi:peptidoglycan/xylan/chitin deacetylase (PgdA/CDA1 family)